MQEARKVAQAVEFVGSAAVAAMEVASLAMCIYGQAAGVSDLSVLRDDVSMASTSFPTLVAGILLGDMGCSAARARAHNKMGHGTIRGATRPFHFRYFHQISKTFCI